MEMRFEEAMSGTDYPNGKPPSSVRLLQVALRTVHILAMALILGALPFGAGFQQLRIPILMTVASGVVLFTLDLAKSPQILLQGSGIAVLLKLVLLGCGHLWPTQQLAFYLAATAVASVGSHMPGRWRHYSLLHRKVMMP
jgi:hypothetical protein